MPVMIQIRNVPENVHRTLKARSALAGTSLSEMILAELVQMAALLSDQELKARLASAEAFAMQNSSANLVRRERDTA